MTKSFDDILTMVKSCSMKKVAVAVAQDENVLEAVKVAKERGIADSILVGDIDAKDKYLEFLKSGTQDYSTEILKKAGVDLEEENTYNIVFKEIKWALDEMEKLI